MALSIMPAEVLPIFAETSRWLVGDDLVPGSACFIMVRSRSAGSIPGIEAALLTRRIGRKDLPYASFFLHFYNFSFQIFLPFSSRDTDLVSRDVNIARFPSRMESLCDVFYLTEDMSSTEWLRGETAELNLRYDSPISFREVTA
jgi:hypothetical protein